MNRQTKEEIKPVYTEPEEMEIAGIPTIIVDPHNEVFEFWYNHLHGNAVPSVLIHVDNHPDMSYGAMTFEEAAKCTKDLVMTPKKYSKVFLNMEDFICTAVFNKLLSGIYWINPREEFVTTYGKVGSSVDRKVSTYDERGIIFWQNEDDTGLGFPVYEDLSIKKFYEELETGKRQSVGREIILDIDLDAFEDRHDSIRVGYESNLEKTIDLLSKISKPRLISIARSQTPYCFTPPEHVDEIQDAVIRELNRIYGG